MKKIFLFIVIILIIFLLFFLNKHKKNDYIIEKQSANNTEETQTKEKKLIIDYSKAPEDLEMLPSQIKNNTQYKYKEPNKIQNNKNEPKDPVQLDMDIDYNKDTKSVDKVNIQLKKSF